jgi:hypothetical protein
MLRDCRIVERPDELVIEVRWISRVKATFLLAIFMTFMIALIWFAGSKTPVVVLAAILSYVALLIALNHSSLRVSDGEVTTSVGPIPFVGGRHKLVAADICEVFSSKTVSASGRGGRMERYALQVRMREGPKPLTLLDAELEADTRAAAQALTAWLNAHRTGRAVPVSLH